MNCKRCNRQLHITSAIKGRARHEPVVRECAYCGYENVITKADVIESDTKKLLRISSKRGIKL